MLSVTYTPDSGSSTETYTYKLEFNCNIGSGNPCGTNLTYTGTETSHTFTIPSVVPTDSTRTFDYWATTNISPIPSSAQYPAGSTITLTSAKTTENLYAIWRTGSTGPDEPYDIGTLNWTKGGSGVLSVDFSRVDGFASTGVSSVQIGTTTLQSGDYVYSSSSQHITMYSSALNQFNAGQYNITIEFTDGFVATGILNVESPTETYTYKLEFNCNIGSGNPCGTNLTYTGTETSHTFTIPSVVPTDSTRTFDYWATTNISPIPSSAQYPAGSTITLTSAKTTQNLYAIWRTGSTDPEYTITLNANGGTGGSTSTTVTEGATALGAITLPTKASTTNTRTVSGFTKTSSASDATISSTTTLNSTSTTSYTFNGWYKEAAATNKIATSANIPALQANTSYTNANAEWTSTDENITLYAGYSSTSTPYNSVTLPIIEKDNYTCGWTTNSSSTSYTYASGASLTPSSDLVLYGVCNNEAPTTYYYQILFDGNGGTASTYSLNYGTTETSHTFTIGSGYTATREGYDFKGWATSAGATTPNVGSTITLNSSMPVDEEGLISKTIYAVWKESSTPVDPDDPVGPDGPVDPDDPGKSNEESNGKNYPITNNTQTLGEDDDLIIKSTGKADKFIGLEIDGEEISKELYEVETDPKTGGIIISIDHDFATDLEDGEHTITLIYEDGTSKGIITKSGDSFIIENVDIEVPDTSSITPDTGAMTKHNESIISNVSIALVTIIVLSSSIVLITKRNGKKVCFSKK